MEQTVLIQQIRELIAPLLAARQVELVDLACYPGGGRMLVRCLVDTPSGITLEKLSGLNRAIGAVLDEHDAVPGRYLLEVSSPGLDRPLKSGTDFERIIGRRIRVQTSVPVDARQEHRGELLSAGEQGIVLRLDNGDKLPIPLDQVTYAVQEIKL